jgi:hypothetical protein
MIEPSQAGCRSRALLGARISRALVVALILASSSTPAAASPDTLRRGLGNIMMGPFDMLLAPVQGFKTVYQNIQDVDDSTGVRVAYAVPGVAWLTMLNFGCGMIRILTGALEVPPGVLLFGFESDIEPLFDPVEDAGALFEWDNPLIEDENPWVYYNPLVAPFAIRVKMGINYTRPDY